jgi:FeS assembly SUF system protein
MSEKIIKHEPTHLPVLPHSGKVEQLRQEVAMSEHQVADRVAGATQPTADQTAPAGEAPKSIEYKLLEGKVIAALSSVYDPEIPVNIYELGLIYKIDIKPDNSVVVEMTLTAPGCPVAGTLPNEVATKIMAVEGVTDAEVQLVWEPTWDKSRMSEAALLDLGML